MALRVQSVGLPIACIVENLDASSASRKELPIPKDVMNTFRAQRHFLQICADAPGVTK